MEAKGWVRNSMPDGERWSQKALSNVDLVEWMFQRDWEGTEKGLTSRQAWSTYINVWGACSRDGLNDLEMGFEMVILLSFGPPTGDANNCNVYHPTPTSTQQLCFGQHLCSLCLTLVKCSVWDEMLQYKRFSHRLVRLVFNTGEVRRGIVASNKSLHRGIAYRGMVASNKSPKEKSLSYLDYFLPLYLKNLLPPAQR